MKKILLLAIAVTGALTLTAHAQFLSPRGQELKDSLRKVPGTMNDPDLLQPSTGYVFLSPRALGNRPTMTIATAERDPDLVSKYRGLAYSGKNPARDLHPMQIEIAPVK